MKEIRLKIRKRAFPSQGRVRLNTALVSDLEINEGDHVDLINEVTKKTVTVTVIADNATEEGQIRVSEEDLRVIGLQDTQDVLIRKTPPLQEKIKKVAADASKSFSKNVDKLDEQVKKTSVDVKASAAKTADTVKKETKKVSDTVGKAAKKTVKEVKKTVKKVTGPKDEL